MKRNDDMETRREHLRGMSDQELTDYIAQIRQRKGGGQTEQEE